MSKEIQYRKGVNYEIASIYTIAEYGPIEAFLEKYDKTKLNEQNKYGFSLLHEAISGEKYDIAAFVIEEGIDVNLKDKSGSTALHSLTHKTDVDNILGIAEQILNCGGDINLPDKTGSTPFYLSIAYAYNFKQTGLVKLFLKWKPDWNIRNKFNMTYHDVAKKLELTDLLELFPPE